MVSIDLQKTMIVGLTVPVSRRQKNLSRVCGLIQKSWRTKFRCLQEMDLGRGKIVSFKELNKAQSASRTRTLAGFKRFVEKRDRDAVQGTVSPIDTAQYRSPRSRTPGPSFDACVRVEMEKKDEGTTDPERAQLEPPSASTGFETPEQQCPPNGETGRTTADGCLLVGVGSNLGETYLLPPKSLHRLQLQTSFSCKRAANPIQEDS